MINAVHKKVLITGVSGGVGRVVYRFLAAQNFQVKGLARPEDDIRGLEISKENLIRGYVEDPQAVCAAMQGVDAVVNCAALLPECSSFSSKEAISPG